MWIQAIREAISLGQGLLCRGDPGCEAVSECEVFFCFSLWVLSWCSVDETSKCRASVGGGLLRFQHVFVVRVRSHPCLFVAIRHAACLLCFFSFCRALMTGISGRHGGEDESRDRSARPTLPAAVLPLLLHRCDFAGHRLTFFLASMPQASLAGCRFSVGWREIDLEDQRDGESFCGIDRSRARATSEQASCLCGWELCTSPVLQRCAASSCQRCSRPA